MVKLSFKDYYAQTIRNLLGKFDQQIPTYSVTSLLCIPMVRSCVVPVLPRLSPVPNCTDTKLLSGDNFSTASNRKSSQTTMLDLEKIVDSLLKELKKKKLTEKKKLLVTSNFSFFLKFFFFLFCFSFT